MFAIYGKRFLGSWLFTFLVKIEKVKIKNARKIQNNFLSINFTCVLGAHLSTY